MHCNSKKIAAMATFSLLTIGASIALMVPAEARRHKAKILHHTVPQQSQLAPPVTDDRYPQPVQDRVQRDTGRASAKLAARSAFASGAPSFGGSGLIAEARRHLGTNPTGRSSLWCGHFMNLVLQRSGHTASGSNMARSFASYGRRISGPQVGAIAVMSRGKNGGHVGVVSGIDESGNPVIISGNHNGRVAETTYPRGRIIAYVMP